MAMRSHLLAPPTFQPTRYYGACSQNCFGPDLLLDTLGWPFPEGLGRDHGVPHPPPPGVRMMKGIAGHQLRPVVARESLLNASCPPHEVLAGRARRTPVHVAGPGPPVRTQHRHVHGRERPQFPLHAAASMPASDPTGPLSHRHPLNANGETRFEHLRAGHPHIGHVAVTAIAPEKSRGS